MKNMTFNSIHPYHRQLILLIVAGIISCAVLTMAYGHYSDAQQKNTQAFIQQDELLLEIHQLVEDKKFLNTVGESFNDIRAQGFLGEEDRLSWGEALKVTAQRLKLSNLKYSIHPQQKISNIGAQTSSSLQLSQSVMDIEADFMHEGDFITLSEELSRMPGLFRVVSCDLAKSKEISLSEPQKNISMKCSLAWHTVKYSTADDNLPEADFDLEQF